MLQLKATVTEASTIKDDRTTLQYRTISADSTHLLMTVFMKTFKKMCWFFHELFCNYVKSFGLATISNIYNALK
jgi:hypothetical protein